MLAEVPARWEGAKGLGSRGEGVLTLAPDNHRLGHEGDPEPLLHAVTDLARDLEQLRRRGTSAVHEGERVLARQPDGALTPALSEARLLDQPGSTDLHATPRLG